MKLESLKAMVVGKNLVDLLRTGFLDDCQPRRFRALRHILYLDLDPLLLKLEAIESTGAMRVEIVEAIQPVADLDDDMTQATASYREEFLLDPDDTNSIRDVRLWGAIAAASELQCAALQVSLTNGQKIFFDPTYHFGIRIGGDDQRDRWLISWPAARLQTEDVL